MRLHDLNHWGVVMVTLPGSLLRAFTNNFMKHENNGYNLNILTHVSTGINS